MRSTAALKLPLLFACTLALSACGSVSGLTREAQDAPQHIADYTRVEVDDFIVDDQKPLEDPTKAAEHLVKVEKARKLFADKIAEQIRATNAFAEVWHAPGTAHRRHHHALRRRQYRRARPHRLRRADALRREGGHFRRRQRPHPE